jgi:hypothetical protein
MSFNTRNATARKGQLNEEVCIMNKVLMLALVLLLAFSNLAYAAPSDTEIMNSFKDYVSKEVNKALATYESNNQIVVAVKDRKPPVWQKIHFTLNADYTIDLRKNDSLIRPYIGTLEIAKVIYFENFATKEAAEQCISPKNRDDSRRYVFTIAYQDDKWVVTRVFMPYYRQEKDILGIYDTLKNQ